MEQPLKRLPVSCVLFLILTTLWSPRVSAQGPIKDVKQDVAFEQHLNAQIPLDTTFRDEDGKIVRLGDLVAGKPIILTLNYFHCQNLCSLELDQLTGALTDLSFSLGDEYEVVSLSFDPRETPNLATETKWQYVRHYARPGRGDGWHFLTGDESQIEEVTQAAGFHYAYDVSTDEFAHPLGIIILTPEGKIARYLYGLDYSSRDLKLALIEASQSKIGSSIDQILLLCYHYDPSNGKYSSLVLDITRASGAATVLVMGSMLGWFWWNEFRRSRSS